MSHRRTNRLLSLLSDNDYERLRPHLAQVELEYRKSLYEASRPIEHVYFPVDGVASLVITSADGAGAEVGTIGSEGMVGLPICLGDREAPSSVYVQVPGSALRMDAAPFRDELGSQPDLEPDHASLRPRLLQPGRAIGRLRASAPGGAALLPLAVDDPRPHAFGRFSAHP